MNEATSRTKRVPKMTKGQRQEAAAMFTRGVEAAAIAEFYGVSKQYIWRIMSKSGFLKPKHKFTAESWDDQYKANKLVHKAIKSGALIPQPCEVCGVTGQNAAGHNLIHAHHDDYNRPLNVRWLCQKHHADWHRLNSPVRKIKP